uniref:Protein quiver n=1 Tax=Panagrolaimus superbus TaxID=310955 RepID=A0A914XRF9_9BILA
MRLSLSRCLSSFLLICLNFLLIKVDSGGHYGQQNMRKLTCMTCIPSKYDTTQLDQFRVRQKLPEPRCDMEPVICRAEQDACATVTMQVGINRFWVGAGCDQRVNYDIPADKHGCAEMATLTRNWLPGYVEERRAIQKICICTGDLCNNVSNFSITRILYFCLFISIAQQFILALATT